MGVETTRTTIQPLVFTRADTPSVLHGTAEQYYDCHNQTSAHCWGPEGELPKQPSDLKTTKRSVRDDIYTELKAEHDLNANLVQAAIRQTVENVDTLQTNWEKGERISQPAYDHTDDEGWCMEFDKRSATFHKYGITLSLADGDRHTVRFLLPDELADTPYDDYVLSDLFEYRITKIVYRPRAEHNYYAHIVTKAEHDVPPLPNPHDTITADTVPGEYVRTAWRDSVHSTDGSDTRHECSRRVLGVDLNVNGSLAVTSVGGFHGNADLLTHTRSHYERVRSGLQRTGTRSAHLTMKRTHGREWAYYDRIAQTVANGVAFDALRARCAHAAFEELKGIRKRISNLPKFQQWMFTRIYEYVTYKLEAFGVAVKQVEAAYSSQACSRTDCDCVHENNRSDNEFECVECGYELDADLNAAKNVAYRYIREEFYGDSVADREKWFDVVDTSEHGVPAGHTSLQGRATSQLALKSGTLSLDGVFTRRDWPEPASSSKSPTSPALKESAKRASRAG